VELNQQHAVPALNIELLRSKICRRHLTENSSITWGHQYKSIIYKPWWLVYYLFATRTVYSPQYITGLINNASNRQPPQWSRSFPGHFLACSSRPTGLFLSDAAFARTSPNDNVYWRCPATTVYHVKSAWRKFGFNAWNKSESCRYSTYSIILPRLQLVNVQADGRYLSLPVSRQAAICFRDPKIKKKFS
jgi:hypothetical protein